MIISYLGAAKRVLEVTLKTNRRSDGLWHAYNVLDIRAEEQAMGIRRLPVMLEGQVAILSSGLLEPEAALDVLETLQTSDLRSKRHPTYLLYPDRDLASFKEMNLLSESSLMSVPALSDSWLVLKDAQGSWRFHESLVNGYALASALDQEDAFSKEERRQIEDLYEEVFCHQSFTGRSGSMFGYEGLGCVYWHMVSLSLIHI